MEMERPPWRKQATARSLHFFVIVSLFILFQTVRRWNLTKYHYLILFSGSLGDPLSVTPKTLSAWEGSCVIISCKIEEEYESRSINQVSFAWYFNPSYDNNIGDYSGKLLYNNNQTITEVSSEFHNRVTFVGDLGRKNCSLKISQLHQNDTGIYGIRLFWKSGSLPEQKKWLSKVNIRVHETPLQLIYTWSPQMEEGSKYTVACSIPYHCFAEPIKLSIEGLEDHHEFSQQMTTETERVKAEQPFKATWKDHKKQLTCLLKTYKGTEIRKKFANLMVKYGPKGVKLNADHEGTLREGNKLTLECIVGSSNPPVRSFLWFKNGKSWSSAQWDARREFHSLKDTDSGKYRCQVDNGIEKISSEDLDIDVQYLPKVSINVMPRLPIQENAEVVLKCSAIGNPPISSYEWYKSSTSGVIMAGEELRFEGIQPSNSDTYRCVARNKIGHSNRSVTLNVNYRPKNVQLFPLNHLPIKEGDKVILNCTVGSSYPSINNYKFFRSTSFIPTSDRRYSASTFFALPELSAFYSCEACNYLGCTSSPSILLDVLYGPKDLKLNREPSGLVLEGDPVRLTCSVGKANPKTLSYTWYKDGERLPLNSTESVLFIQNAQSMDSGRYHCVSKNIITNAVSPSIRLEVNYGPRNVHVTLDKKSVTEGMDVYLKCDNDAYPLVDTYKWYWKGEEIFMENSKILVLRKIKPEQSGEYLCKAFNSVSNKESQLLTISVSYSRATMMKLTLISLGIVLALIISLGLLAYGLKRWKKATRSDIGRTQRTGSFFVRKAKRELPPNNNSRPNGGRTESPLDCQDEDQDGTISYARLQFAHSGLQDRTIYSSVMQPNVGLDSSDNSTIYSVVNKPALHPKNDTKVDYENVMKKEEEEEEELHYSSLVNLAPRSRPINADLETDSESEGSIQYAALKH
ncbi:B-cell receptor CD22-like [Thamnophis elegans]|uniref:B-cell receptor CD22-like n=1 Tax=Thamnophis elegans TaxID=35005 RepID=UPI001377CA1C|nr:B-cell receptor CD22-like [Thamnophis elegans]